MVKFARIKILDSSLAEDAVQDALLSAIYNINSFSGRSSLKTWIFSILKNKIYDILRRQYRLSEAEFHEPGNRIKTDTSENHEVHQSYSTDTADNYRGCNRPDIHLENLQLSSAISASLTKLPNKQARVFLLYEHFGFSSDEICTNETLTSSNLYVTLYRARSNLQSQLKIQDEYRCTQ